MLGTALLDPRRGIVGTIQVEHDVRSGCIPLQIQLAQRDG